MKTTHFLVPVIGLALLASCHTEVTPAAISKAQFLQLLDELRPVDIADAEKQRFGPEKDGGYVMIAGQDYDALYSYGIGRDMEFESHFVKENPIPAYLYDHTISGFPEENFLVRLFTGNRPRPSSLITWKPEGIGPRRTANLNWLFRVFSGWPTGSRLLHPADPTSPAVTSEPKRRPRNPQIPYTPVRSWATRKGNKTLINRELSL